MQLMRAEDPRANRVEQVGQISRGLKILARELKRARDRRLAALARARAAARQAADALGPAGVAARSSRTPTWSIFIYRAAKYDEEADPSEADLIIAKHRNGPTGDVPVVFLEQYPAVRRQGRRRRAAGGAESG